MHPTVTTAACSVDRSIRAPFSQCQPPQFQTMASSLTEKLQLLRAQKETSSAADQMTEIKLMSLEELEKETIQFGKPKPG